MNFREKLTREQIKELEGFTKSEEYSDKEILKAMGILLVEAKASEYIIELTTTLSRRAAVEFRKKYIKKGLEAILSKKRDREVTSFLTRNQKSEIIEVLKTKKPSNIWMNAANAWTTAYLGRYILENYSVQYSSKTSLYLIFTKASFTFRKPEKFSEKRDEKKIQEWKDKYAPIIKKELLDENSVVLAGDECILTSATRLQKAWLPSAHSAPHIDDTAKRKIASYYGFLDVESGKCHAFHTKSQTGKITVEVLKKIAKIYKGKRIVLIWDNASWHKSKEIREFLTTVTQFQLYNFPAYSPDLNPIEHVWKEMKDKIFSNRLITDLDQKIVEATEFLSKSTFKYKFFDLHSKVK